MRLGVGCSAPCFVAIGDSFSAGTEAGVAPFPDRVAARLPGWRYSNLAARGARSRDVLDHQLERAVILRPDLVLVVCGANDVVRTTRPDLAAFAENLERILARLLSPSPAVGVVTATYPAVPRLLPLRPRSRARVTTGLHDVNAIVRALSVSYGAVCLELAGHPGRAEPENFAADGFHPSSTGHANAALALAACLRDQLDVRIESEEAAA